MKKISLLLTLLILISSVISACGDTAGTSFPAASSVSLETSSAVSEEVSHEEKPSAPESGVLTDISVRENPHATVISNGASYVATPGINETYPDPYGTKLTDGIRGAETDPSYTNEEFAGFVAGSGQSVVLDLGSVRESVYQFRVGYMDVNSAGIEAPASIMIYGSLDSKTWEKLGSAEIPEPKPSRTTEAVLTLSNYVKVRYVRFYIKGRGFWFFLDELSVIADEESTDPDAVFLQAVKDAYQTLGTVARPTGGEAIDFDLNKILLSKGASYTIVGKVHSQYPDDRKILTDGAEVGEGRVSLESDENSVIRVSLGQTATDIASLEATFFVNTAVGVFLPPAVKVTAVDEKGGRTDIGILYATTTMQSGSYTFSLPLSKTVSAKEVEFTVYATDSKMFLAEEFAVYAYRTEQGYGTYPPIMLDSSEAGWGSEATEDYVNLVAGTTQQIIEDSEPSASRKPENTPVTSKLMTDGITAGASYDIHNGKFFKFFGGAGRTIIFDLGKVSAVDKITASFTHIPSWGVQAPKSVQVCVTTDGKTWYLAGVMEKPAGDTNNTYQYELKLNKKIKARYVSLYFTFESWVGCDEVEVFGTTSVAKAVSAASAGLEEYSVVEGRRLAPSKELIGGAKDTCLLYQSRTSAYKAEDLIPYLAYVDEEGNIKDVMFDSFLFLYYGDFPGGGASYGGGKLEGWQWALNDLFKEGTNIYALDEAAGTVKEALGLGDDYTYKVILSLYYPTASITDFGDIDGDGVSEDFSVLANRLKALQCYMDQIEELYAAGNFKNIELVGYYWFHETVNGDDTESMAMLNAVSDMVHAKGKDFCWIPYFMANGFESWKEYGFDVAVMQPNYVFKLEAPYSNLIANSKFTSKYGMGVEMELCSQVLSDERFYKRYMEYLACGVEYGYMTDCIVMYYQEMMIFREACYSGGRARTVYDATYHFIKGDLQTIPAALPDMSFEGQRNAPITGTLPAGTDRDRAFGIYTSPDEGSLTINSDGTFVYYPPKDFTGEVTFRLCYREMFGWSEPFEVTLTVK